jgi:hypothetical protein
MRLRLACRWFILEIILKRRSEGSRRVKERKETGGNPIQEYITDLATNTRRWCSVPLAPFEEWIKGIRRRIIYPLVPDLLWLGFTPQSIHTCSLLGCPYMTIRQTAVGPPYRRVREASGEEAKAYSMNLGCLLLVESTLKPCVTFCQDQELRLRGGHNYIIMRP